MDIFVNNLNAEGFNVNESKSASLPPASLHSFLKIDPQFPGVILTGFKEEFKNKYVNYKIIIILNFNNNTELFSHQL